MINIGRKRPIKLAIHSRQFWILKIKILKKISIKKYKVVSQNRNEIENNKPIFKYSKTALFFLNVLKITFKANNKNKVENKTCKISKDLAKTLTKTRNMKPENVLLDLKSFIEVSNLLYKIEFTINIITKNVL